jgi:hypothetical protein
METIKPFITPSTPEDPQPEEKPKNELISKTRDKLKAFAASLKELSHKAIDSIPNPVLGTLGSALLLKSVLMLAEYNIRLSDEVKFNEAKDVLTKYSAHFSQESYKQKYDRAVSLFGKELVDDITLTPEAMGVHMNMHKERVDDKLNELHERMFSFKEIWNTPIDHTIFGKTALEVDEVQKLLSSEPSKDPLESAAKLSQPKFRGNDYPDQIIFEDIYWDDSENNSNERSGPEVTVNLKELYGFLKITMPKDWVNGEIDSLHLTQEKDTDDNSVYFQDQTVNASAKADYAQKEGTLTTYEFNRIHRKHVVTFMADLFHEFGHANDWSTDNALSAEERLDLILNTYKRLDAPDRLFSDYVEAISNNNPYYKNYMKCEEYYAEICSEYLLLGRLDLSPRDVELVEGVIRKSDPDFDIENALHIRRKLLKSKLPETFKKSIGMTNRLRYAQNTLPLDYLQYKANLSYLWPYFQKNREEINKYYPKEGGISGELPADTPPDIRNYYKVLNEHNTIIENLTPAEPKFK